MLKLDDEYVIMPVRVLEKIVRYALSLCQDRCPEERDPETCLHLVRICRYLRIGCPPCSHEYGDYRVDVISEIVKSIERKYKLRARDFLALVERRGPKSLEESIDYAELKFALGLIEAMKRRDDIYVARGSDIKVIRATRI